jgi:Uma2 family endonuclease
MTIVSDVPHGGAVVYPDSDGKPMADNTLQFEWITILKTGFDALFADRADVFVAGDLLWYPVLGRPDVSVAPDVLVCFGRPKGYRGSYKQWEEDNLPPTVVIEILSPNNSAGEMASKAVFYDWQDVQEYYLYDPYRKELSALWRSSATGRLELAAPIAGVITSPRTLVRFDRTGDDLVVIRPDGEPFKDFVTILAERDAARDDADQQRRRAGQEAQRAEQEMQRAEQEAQRANAAAERADRLAAQLRAVGVDPTGD